MRGTRQQFLLFQYASDLLGVVLGLLAAYWVRFHSGLDPAAAPAREYHSQLLLAVACWLGALHVCGAWHAHPHIISFNRARRLLNASMLAVLLLVLINYFLRAFDVSRILFPLAVVLVSGTLVLNRAVLQIIISRYFVPRGARARVLIVGTGPVARRLAARFKALPSLGYDLVGFVSLTGLKIGQTIGGMPILGTREELRRLIRDNQVEEVFVTQTDIPGETFFQLFLDSERETARVSFVPSLVEMMRTSIHYDEVAGVPVYSMRETPLHGANATIKRAFDVAGAGFGLLLLSPLLALVALAVKRSSPGPALYKQTRLGLDGREFKIYKFRTMRTDAEAAGPGWGNQDDPRATPIGRWLRRTNIDELPQLWNVLRGDMSLVGPRPERPVFVERFREVYPRYMSRHLVKTGMTGWAQVHGLRGNTSILSRLRYDLYYIENWSLWLDIKILIMTFLPGRRRRGMLRGVGFAPSGRMGAAEVLRFPHERSNSSSSEAFPSRPLEATTTPRG